MILSHLRQSYLDASQVLSKFVEDEQMMAETARLSEALAHTFESGGKALIAGNGGSACDAMHFAEEFTGRYRANRKALPVISLTDSSHITCVGNDFGFESIFSRGVEAYGKPGDIFIGLSTSGNSPNINKAIDEAKALGLQTVALLGRDGGALKGLADFEFLVPASTSDRIQEVHMTVLHIVIEGVERLLFPENY